MNYCTKCGKPLENGFMCEECVVSNSPWLLAMKTKENDLAEEVAKLKSENAALRERLGKSVDKKAVSGFLAEMFDCPCNFSPLDEEMFDYCNDCIKKDAVCWERVIDNKIARLAELKGEK